MKRGDRVVCLSPSGSFLYEGVIMGIDGEFATLSTGGMRGVKVDLLSLIKRDEYYSEPEIVEIEEMYNEMEIASNLNDAEFYRDFSEIIKEVTKRSIKRINEFRITEKPEKPELDTGGLTMEQYKAFTEIQSWLLAKKPDSKIKKLVGYAGTGKTYLISRIVQSLESVELLMVSPTNKALKVLKSNFSAFSGGKITFLTLAQALGKQPIENNEKMEEEFKVQDKRMDIDSFSAVIADEYSMISDEDLGDLLLKASKTRILFVGDNAQLPPVREEEPPVDDLDDFDNGMNTWKLSEVLRYGGQLGLLAGKLREVSPRNVKQGEFSGDSSLVWIQERSQVKNLMKDAAKKFLNEPDAFRVLTYTNKSCDIYNQQFRLYLWGLEAHDKPYHVGERLIARSPVYRRAIDGVNKVKVLNNSDEVSVFNEPIRKVARAKNINPEQDLLRIVEDEWVYWEIPLIGHSLRILDEWCVPKFKDVTEKLRKSKIIKEKKCYWEMKKLFDDLTYAYALTTHKAQGSTLSTALVLWGEFQGKHLKPDMSQKLAYTAITRCKDTAYLLP